MNPHQFGNLDPDSDQHPQQGDKPDPDPDPHQSVKSDPQKNFVGNIYEITMWVGSGSTQKAESGSASSKSRTRIRICIRRK